jgi:lysozyme family protein
MDYDFLRIMPLIFRDEGGFQCDPDDRGNYRPGGALVGTKYGISAASYPDLDIPSLTEAQATQLYYIDWWQRYHFGMLIAPLSMKVFDIAINCGATTAVKELQNALRSLKHFITADGIIGPSTANACLAAAGPPLWAAFVSFIEAHYESIARDNSKDQKYLKGWLARATEVMPT